jgi:hypothetical protein
MNPPPNRDQHRRVDCNADFLLDFAARIEHRFASTKVPTYRAIDPAGHRILVQTPPLKEQKRTRTGVITNDPDVNRLMPIAIPVHIGTTFDNPGGIPPGIDNIEEFIRILREK